MEIPAQGNDLLTIHTAKSILNGALSASAGAWILAFYSILRRRSKAGKRKAEFADAVLHFLVRGLATEVERTHRDPLWTMVDHVGSDPLKRQVREGRLRRIGAAYKIAVHRAVSHEQGVRTCGQFLASMRISRRRKHGASQPTAASGVLKKRNRKRSQLGKRFTDTLCKQYQVATRRCMSTSRHMYWAMDGMRCTNIDLVVACVGNPVEDVCAWVAPQVREYSNSLRLSRVNLL